jgi:aldehyde:ferredoxin oxidoreductase
VICGKAKTKTYLNITNDKVEFLPADKLWGMTTGEAQEALGGKSGKIVIGPAGENLVRYACIVSEERAAGRGGLGAVMGSKNLKAIVAQGNFVSQAKDKEKLKKLSKKWVKKLKEHPLTGEQLPKLGTAGLISKMHFKNLLATKNFSYGQFEGHDKINGEYMAEHHLIKNSGCISCPIKCGRVVEVDGKQVKGPELETLGLLGANILNDNIELILRWNHLLDEMGMDTISAAGCLSFAMELNEKGLWKNELEFGKTDNIERIIKETAFRSSAIGNTLADGTREMSKKFGGEDFCISSKGMEISAYEPRSAVGQGLGYAVSNRGGCHLNAGYLVVLEGLGLSINQYTHWGKAALTVTFQNLMEAVSAGGNCLFTTYAVFPSFLIDKPNGLITRIVNKVMPYLGGVLYLALKFPQILAVNLPFILPHPVAINAVTGMKLNFGKMLRLGERGYNLERLFNKRMGVNASWDALPKRLTDELQDKNNPKSKVPLEKLKKRYYKIRGWDIDGLPTEKLIKKLGIE